MKKLLSILLTVMLVVSVLPSGLLSATASAATTESVEINSVSAVDIPATVSETTQTGGTTGNCTWKLEGTKLTISGNGRMGDYSYPDVAPWGTDITEVVIENGVTSIGKDAFRECTGLASVTIPNGVTRIGNSAFDGCTGLTSVTIPDSVTSVSSYAFFGCSNLQYNCFDKGYYLGNENNKYLVLVYAKLRYGGHLELADGVKVISETIFFAAKGSMSITLPSSVTNIGEDAFWTDGGDGVTINITDLAKYCEIDFEGPANASIVHLNGESVTELVIPNSVKEIKQYAFSKWKTLTRVTIPKSVTVIDYNAFYKCDSLKVILGYKGSKAEEYAKLEGIKFYMLDKPTAPTVKFNSTTSITLTDTTDCDFNYEYSMDGKTWQSSSTFDGLRPNTEYKFYRRVVGVEKYEILPGSTSEVLTVSTLKNTVSTPSAPTVDSKTANSVTLKATDGYEYSMDGITWQTDNVFGGLSVNTSYTFYQRVAETETSYASEISSGATVTTLKMTITAPSAPTVDKKSIDFVILKENSYYEFSMDGKTWQKSNVFENLNPDTEYTFYQRVAETGISYASASSVALKVKTYKLGDLNGDDAVSDVDAVYLLRYTFMPDNYPVNQACDFNGDGEINDKDAIYLLRHTFMPEKYPLG